MAAVACGFDRIWDSLEDWEISVILRKRLADSPSEDFGALNVFNRRAWDSALETIWDHAWDGGPVLARLTCAEVARQIVESFDQTGACGPEIIIRSQVRTSPPAFVLTLKCYFFLQSQLHSAPKKLCTHAMLQSHALGQLNEIFPSREGIKETVPKSTQHFDTLGFVSRTWAEIRTSTS